MTNENSELMLVDLDITTAKAINAKGDDALALAGNFEDYVLGSRIEALREGFSFNGQHQHFDEVNITVTARHGGNVIVDSIDFYRDENGDLNSEQRGMAVVAKDTVSGKKLYDQLSGGFAETLYGVSEIANNFGKK